jgi:hypothetical protein
MKCECGCGEKVKFGKRFLRGHNLRINNPVDRLEVRKKIRENRRGLACGDRNGMRQIGISDKVRGSKNGMNLPGVREKHKKILVEIGKCWRKEGRWVGDRNPNWQGGLNNEGYPYEFTEDLKEQIRNRDSNICQFCGRTKEQEGRNLPVHHIDYNKENCIPANLITLCTSCNFRANYNRSYWQAIFTEMNCIWLGT